MNEGTCTVVCLTHSLSLTIQADRAKSGRDSAWERHDRGTTWRSLGPREVIHRIGGEAQVTVTAVSERKCILFIILSNNSFCLRICRP